MVILRRCRCRGGRSCAVSGAALALPLLDAMVPRADGAGQDGGAVRGALRGRLHSRTADHGAVDAEGGGHGLRVHADPEAARAVPRSLVVVSNLTRPAGRRRAATTRSRRRLADRRQAEADRSRGHLAGTTIDQLVAERSGRTRRSRRWSSRPRTSPGTSGACTHGLQLRLHEHHLVAHAARRRCRWRSIRGRCSSACSADSGSAARAGRAAPRDRSILDSIAETAPSAARPRRGATAPARRVSRQRARDRAPHPAGRGAATAAELPPIDAPVGVPDSFDEHVGLMFDLQRSPTRPT